MAKNQKKPTALSMGGIVPRRPQRELIKPQEPADPEVEAGENKPKLPKIADYRNLFRKSEKKRRAKIFSAAAYLKSKFFYFVIPLFIAGLYLFDINRFPPELSESSLPDGSLSDIDSIEYLPVKIILVFLGKLSLGDFSEARLLSVFIMLLALFCFYKLISTWLSRRMSVLALLLYSSSSWALFQARQDNVTTLMFGLIPVILYLGHLLINSGSRLGKIILSIVLIQFIFVPGAVWFFLFTLVGYLAYFRKTAKVRSILLPLAAMFLTVVSYGVLIIHLSLNDLAQFIKIAGFEVGGIPSLGTLQANITDLPSQLFLGGLNDSSMWLRGTPIIDWVTAVFLVAGLVYSAKSKSHPARKMIILLFLLLSILLISINGATYISLLLPLVYMVVAIGIAYLIDQWMIIFPSNPLARSLGLVLVCFIVLMVCGYHVERYFIGWPKTDEYHQIFKN